MNLKDEALKMAIEALSQYTDVVGHKFNAETWGDIEDKGKAARDAINACKKALEQPAQEPLSDDEIDKLLSKFVECLGTSHGIQENGIPEDSAVKFIRAIEQAHGIGVNK